MLNLYLKRIIASSCLFLVLALAACGGSTVGTTTTNTSTRTPTPQQEISGNSTTVTLTPTSSTRTSATPIVATSITTPGTGPQVILTPTPASGGNGQLVTLPDRTLVIESVSKQQGNGPNSTAVSLVLTMNNTSTQPIPNQASYYQLMGTEGDAFGYQSSATPSFFGIITAHNSRSGTIVFQVPTAALSGLRLLFRSASGTETVFVQLTIR